MAIKSGRDLFGRLHHGAFELLRYMPPGLILDVGAAAGYYTKVALQKSPKSRVVAFEPFPGNIPHFKKLIGDDPRVTLHEKAVSDRSGPVQFYVSQTVTQGQGVWRDFEGYSSVGYIVPEKSQDMAIDVEAVALDDVVSEPVRFIKIDVQGGEERVLKGAERLWREGRIDMMYVESSGEPEVLEILVDRGYLIFDSTYTIMTREDPDLSEWDIVNEVTLSTGRKSLQAWPKAVPAEPSAYLDWFKTGRRKSGSFFTDLVCVAPAFEATFLQACSDAAKK